MIFTNKTNKIITNKKQKTKLKYQDMYKLEPFAKRGKKVPNEFFVIPKFDSYNNLIKLNYNKSQLKKILKKYKQRVSGNKEIIRNRCYNFLRLSYFSSIIQTKFRSYIVKEYIRVSGPAIRNSKLCTNNTDFLSLEKLSTVKRVDLFSYKDEDDFIYGFDFCSIYNLLLNGKSPKNPYNRKELPKNILENINKKVRLSKLLRITIKTEIDNIKINPEKEFKFRVLAVFHKMDELGNYTNLEWFNSLNKIKLIRFTKELLDIWHYRAQLTNETKRQIFPPFGNPFEKIKTGLFIHKNENKIKKIVLFLIENLITKGIDKQSKCLGAYYVLGALTLVNTDAAAALPWLYDSVRYNNPIQPTYV